MTEETLHNLAIKITPSLDIEALTKQIKDALVKAGVPITVTNTNSSQQGPNSTNAGPGEQSKFKKGTLEYEKANANANKDTIKSLFSNPISDAYENKGAPGGQLKLILTTIKTIGTVIKGAFEVGKQIFTGIFGIVKEIHSRVKQSSAFLATVENLFNLAMTLLLLPLGNALAEVILPSATKLIEKIVDMYDDFQKFTGKEGLNNIVKKIMNEGLKLFGEWFKDVGQNLKDSDNNLLSGIGSLMTWLGNLMEHGKIEEVLSMMFDVFKILSENMNVWIPIIIGLMTRQLLATMFSGLGGLGTVLSMSGGLAVGGYEMYNLNSNASGGYYPATSGGQVIRVAEAGEGEYVIPESKMNNISQGSTYNVYINGATTDEIKSWVREYTDDQMRQSRYRNGI